MAFIVEAEAIDDTFVFDQTEDTRPGIAGLRLGRDGAETEPQKRPRHFRILVVTRRHAERIGEDEASHGLLQTGIVRHHAGGQEAAFQRRNGQAMRLFRIDQKQALAAD